MTTIAPPAPTTKAFPLAEVKSCLRDELIETIKSMAKIKGISLPATTAQIAAASVQIDSLVCLEILCAVEPIVQFELPDKVVKAGGYRSVDSAIKNLLPRIQSEWNKNKGVTS